MPFGDGTGPRAQGLKKGKGVGRARKGGRPGSGPGGTCICPSCGISVLHQAGVSCSSMICPWCGSEMIRG
jgi:hypothetical protein